MHHLTSSNVALGLIPAVGALGGLLPPILGGVLADRLGIGVIFVLSLLLGVTGTWFVRRHLRDPRIEAAGQGTRGRSGGIIPEP